MTPPLRRLATSMGALALAVAASAADEIHPSPRPLESALLDAVLLGDAAKVQALLEKGASPDARNADNQRTVLFFAAEKGDLPVVRLLLAHGADVRVADAVHRERAVGAAARNRHADVVRALLAKDDTDTAGVAVNAVYQDSPELLGVALETGSLQPEDLSCALELARRQGSEAVAAALQRAGASTWQRGEAPTPESLSTYEGEYAGDSGPPTLSVAAKDGSLYATLMKNPPLRLIPLDRGSFTTAEGPVVFKLQFQVASGGSVRASMQWVGSRGDLTKVAAPRS